MKEMFYEAVVEQCLLERWQFSYSRSWGIALELWLKTTHCWEVNLLSSDKINKKEEHKTHINLVSQNLNSNIFKPEFSIYLGSI